MNNYDRLIDPWGIKRKIWILKIIQTTNINKNNLRILLFRVNLNLCILYMCTIYN